MRVTTLCMLFVSIAIVFLTMGPRENHAADKALVALKKAAGIALLLQRKKFRVIPIPLPLPLPLPIPIELKQKPSWPAWPSHHQTHHAPSWPSISHSWSAPAHVISDSWSGGGSYGGGSYGGGSYGGGSYGGGDSWSASEGYSSIADSYGGYSDAGGY